MPKHLPYQLQWSLQTQEYELLHDGKLVAPSVKPSSPRWFAWLETLAAFSFQSRSGARWTVRKERMRRGGIYWYAYQRRGRQMVKRYLGRSSDLTLARLEAVTAILSGTEALSGADGFTDAPLATELCIEQPPEGTRAGTFPAHTRNGPLDLARSNRQTEAALPSPLLLMTKLEVPRATRLIPRPSVEQHLTLGLERPLTLVMAPAGSGKTSSLCSWVQRRGRPVAWVSLDDSDNDPIQFWTYLLTSVDRVYPGVAETARAVLQASYAPSLQAVARALLNAVATCSQDVVLVLDDYHRITTPALHESLMSLLERPPATLHLYLATRALPPFSLTRMRAYGQVNEVCADALRFRREEVATFLREIMGVSLSEEEVTRLATRTEGWITGVHLAELALQTHPEPSRFIATFGGNHLHLFRYLNEEVLAGQAAPVQSFLMQTSILDRLCGAVCDAVTGQEDGRAMLDLLSRANLFVVPLDDEGRWYRYTPLFADFLRHRLRDLCDDEQLGTLHRRAARWLEQQGWISEAVEHSFAVPDLPEAARLIEQAALPLFMSGEILPLRSLLERLPEAVITARPMLCLYQAALFFLLGRLEAAEQRIASAEAWLQARRAAEQQESDAHARLRGVIAASRAVAAVQRGQSEDAIRYATVALAMLPEDDLFSRASVVLPLGLASSLQGALPAANAAFAEAARLNLAMGNLPLATVALVLRAQVLCQQGQLRQAAQLYRETIRLTQKEDGTARPIASSAYAGLGAILYEWNDLVGAKLALEKAIALAQLRALGEDQVSGYARLAFVSQAQGQVRAAQESMRTAEELFAQLVGEEAAPPWLAPLMTGWRLRLALRQGHLREIQQGRQEEGLADDQVGALEREPFQEFKWLTITRIFLAEARLDEAAQVLSHLRKAAEQARRTGSLIEILLLQAQMEQAQGQGTAALEALQEALSLAEPEGYVRLFVDEGIPLRSLLLRLREGQPRGTVLRRYSEHLLAADRPGSFQFQPESPVLIEPLSQRERDVLFLLAQGCSTQDIARVLVVAPSTVKTHLHHLFAKLQVTDRFQAVTRARELGLLEQ